MKNTGRSIQRVISSATVYSGRYKVVERSIIGEGAEIYGEVHNSVIGCRCNDWKGYRGA